MAYQHEVDIIREALESAHSLLTYMHGELLEESQHVVDCENEIDQLENAMSELDDIERGEDVNIDDIASEVRDLGYTVTRLREAINYY